MIKYCNPKYCIYDGCKKVTSNILCSKHKNIEINFIPYYHDIDPFKIENIIINIQYYFKNKELIKKNKLIINNIKNLGNKNDPITQERIIDRKYLNSKYLFQVLFQTNFYQEAQETSQGIKLKYQQTKSFNYPNYPSL